MHALEAEQVCGLFCGFAHFSPSKARGTSIKDLRLLFGQLDPIPFGAVMISYND